MPGSCDSLLREVDGACGWFTVLCSTSWRAALSTLPPEGGRAWAADEEGACDVDIDRRGEAGAAERFDVDCARCGSRVLSRSVVEAGGDEEEGECAGCCCCCCCWRRVEWARGGRDAGDAAADIVATLEVG